MQIARLTPALRLAAKGVAEGDARAIPLLLSLVDRLDRYSDPDTSFRSPPLEEFVRLRARPRRIAVKRPVSQPPAAAGEAPSEPEPIVAEPSL